MKGYAILIGLIVGGGLLAWRSGALSKLNPINIIKDPGNLAHGAAQSVTESITGKTSDEVSPGTLAFDVIDSIKDFLPFVDSVAEKSAKASQAFRETLEPNEYIDYDINDNDTDGVG